MLLRTGCITASGRRVAIGGVFSRRDSFGKAFILKNKDCISFISGNTYDGMRNQSNVLCVITLLHTKGICADMSNALITFGLSNAGMWKSNSLVIYAVSHSHARITSNDTAKTSMQLI